MRQMSVKLHMVLHTQTITHEESAQRGLGFGGERWRAQTRADDREIDRGTPAECGERCAYERPGTVAIPRTHRGKHPAAV